MKRDLSVPSPRQFEALCFITHHRNAHGYPPTIRNIGDELGIGSTNAVNDLLRGLEKKGFIFRAEFSARAIVPTDRAVRYLKGRRLSWTKRKAEVPS